MNSIVLTSNEKFEIVKNASKEIWLEIINKVVEEVGWQYSVYDYDVWNNSYDNFALYYVIDKKTKKAAAIVSLTKLTLNNSETLSTIGMFYVSPEYRSQKIGFWLFNIMYADATKNCFLLGVKEMFEKYRDRFLFNVIPNYQFFIASVKVSDFSLENLVLDKKKKQEFQIFNWNDINFEQICSYDLKICGGVLNRQNFLKLAFSQPDAIVKVVLDDFKKVVGFCRIRKIIGDNLDLGPLYADNKNVAMLLLKACLDTQLNCTNKISKEMKLFYRPISNNSDCKEVFDKLIPNKNYTFDDLIPQYTLKCIEFPTKNVYSLFEPDTCYV